MDFIAILESPTADTAEAHLVAGLLYLEEAEAQMAQQIHDGSGTFNPPFSLEFAKVHLMAAQVIAR